MGESRAGMLLLRLLMFSSICCQFSYGARILAQSMDSGECSALSLEELESSALLALGSRCYTLPTQQIVWSSDIQIEGKGASTSLDLEFHFNVFSLAPGVAVTFRGVNLLGVVLFPHSGNLSFTVAAILPDSYGENAVAIINSSMEITCTVLNDYKLALGDLAEVTESGIFIQQYTDSKVTWENVELYCNESSELTRPKPTGVLTASNQFFAHLKSLSELDQPAELRLTAPIVQINKSDWGTPMEIRKPSVIVGDSQGQRTWLDLDLSLSLTRNTGPMTVEHCAVINQCSVEVRYSAGGFQMINSFLVPLFSLGSQKSVVRDSIMVVTRDTLTFYIYWGIVLVSPFQRLEVLTEFIQVTGIKNATFNEAPLPSAANVSLLSGTGTAHPTFNNVLLVQEPPADMPSELSISSDEVWCTTGEPVNRSATETLIMRYVQNASSLMGTLQELSRLSRAVYPPVVLITCNTTLSVPANGPIELDGDVLLTGPLDRQAFLGASTIGNPTNVSLNLSYAFGAVSVSKPSINLYIQRLTLTDAVARDLFAGANRPSSESTSTQISSLPLWAFQLSEQRLVPQLHLNSVTLILLPADFLRLYYAALRGSAWKTGSQSSEVLVKATSVFNVSYVDKERLVFSNFVGWGMNATNLMVMPSSKVDPVPVVTGNPPSDEPAGSGEGSNDNNAVAIGVGVGVGVAALLGIVGFALWWRKRKAGKDQENGHVAKDLVFKVSTSDDNTGSMHNLSGCQIMRHTNSEVHPGEEGGALGQHSAFSSAKNLDPQVMAMWQTLYGSGTAQLVNRKASNSALLANVNADASDLADLGVDPSTERNSASESTKQKSVNGTQTAPTFDPHKEVAQLVEDLSNEGDKLTLMEAIGQGGFGTVYRGRWRNLEVAVKTVLFSEDRSGLGRTTAQPHQRAVLEAAVCTSVMHPNVVITYHFDISPVQKGTIGLKGMTIEETGGNPDWKLYLVQEYCHASLQDALRNFLLHDKVTLAPDMDLVLTVLLDIARGMQYIHDKNIIHGDLTPGNVLIKQDSESPIGVVGKITDFGLCNKISPGQSHISNITNGTPFYVAPEVVSSNTLTKSSDVYSFGVLMWELYRCMPPWVKTDTGFTQNKRFRRFPADSPRAYVLLCARCLSKVGKSRPSFDEILVEMGAMHAAYLAGYDSLEDPVAASGQTATAAAAGTSPSANAAPPPANRPGQLSLPAVADSATSPPLDTSAAAAVAASVLMPGVALTPALVPDPDQAPSAPSVSGTADCPTDAGQASTGSSVAAAASISKPQEPRSTRFIELFQKLDEKVAQEQARTPDAPPKSALLRSSLEAVKKYEAAALGQDRVETVLVDSLAVPVK